MNLALINPGRTDYAALPVTAIKLAEKTPSPAGEGWGEGDTQQVNPFKTPLIPACTLATLSLTGERSEGAGAKLLISIVANLPVYATYPGKP